MITLRMLHTIDGCVAPLAPVVTYRAGETYSLPDDGEQGLAAVFLREGWAERVEVMVPEAVVETPAAVPVVAPPPARRGRGKR